MVNHAQDFVAVKKYEILQFSLIPSPQSPVVTVALLCCPHHLFPYGSVINVKYFSSKYFVPKFKYYPSTCEI